MKARIIAIAAGLILIAAIIVWAVALPSAEHEIGSYMTGLRGRTLSQIHNVALSARQINNTVLMPGQTFSFCRAVGSWTADRGYKKAPVSYDGELVRSWGGGVCQTSTTLYNAALLAGLQIIERNRHHWPAKYAPLGRDAAVAYEDIDLCFRNNLPEPVRIVCAIEGDELVCKIMSAYQPKYQVNVESEIRSVIRPKEVIQDRAGPVNGRWRLINRGHPGFYVVTYRRFIYPNDTRRELLSKDRYPAMNRIVRVSER